MKKIVVCLLVWNMAVMGTAAFAAEGNKVIVTVNGEAILQEELDNMVRTLSSRMAQYGIDATDESIVEVIESSALTELVDDRLLTQDMTAQDCYTMTEEEEEAIAGAAQASWENLSEESGYTLEYMENYYRNALASEKYEEWLMKDEPDITESEIQEGYEQRVEESQETYAEDVSAFETALAVGRGVWYRPAGYRAILQIMIATEGEDDDARLASVKDKTDDIYDRLEQGESFETLIKEYGEDTSFDNESFFTTGYQVHRDSILWEEAFVEASFGDDMQEIGDYSEPIVFGDQVHILYYLKDVPEGAVELSEDLAEALRSEIYAEKANAKMEERLAQLKEESEIVYTEE